MSHIAIVSSSIRTGRQSHRVALFFKNFLEENNFASTEILDLLQFNFPLFTERLSKKPEPSAGMLDFAEKIKAADGVLIVTPEYNGGYPASLKNVIDLLLIEWRRKPVAISTVSSGTMGGSQVIMSLQFTLWKMQAWTVPAMFTVSNVSETFDERGIPTDKATVEKRASKFLDELLWCMEAAKKMM
ncbi:MAG: NAD(P)H-dependent oxidoreductase [Flavobacteriales bacterium]|nr:NAD(P)H-dependent oxidoreductase [Flavobacteriales bacterium]